MIRVIQYGVGAIGREMVKLLLDRGFELIGAIDIDKEIVGKDLGEVVGRGRLGITVTADPREALSRGAEVVLHSTSSRLEAVYPQIVKVLEAGSNLISTCEELAYPYHRHPGLARRIDKLAVKHGVRVLGTGVNPGFIMDLLPLVLTGVCREVRRLEITRSVDAGSRRRPLQEKIGVGLTPEEFQERVARGGGHVGLVESIAMIGAGLSWELEEIEETIEPVIADSPEESEFFKVGRGEVLGLRQHGYGIRDGERAITLNLEMFLSAEDYDRIRIEGSPTVELLIEGGVHGDIATSAVAVNSIPRVLSAPPGLRTMWELPPPTPTPAAMAAVHR
ncbi:TPA: dihydrodipicolinate reductase [Candidatus Bipolaricaulota bacterium]|nr:dihydrodipicolinate reductase [Candidatus Bipolaricaulota bacterium]